MANQFGKRVIGEEAYLNAVEQEKGGADVFGKRVVGANYTKNAPPTARNVAQRASEFGVRTVRNASFQNTKGEPVDGIAVDELENVLKQNPSFFDSLYEAELARPEGPRTAALQVFAVAEFAPGGQGRRDVLEEINELLGTTQTNAVSRAADAKTRIEQYQQQEQRSRENVLLQDAPRVRALKEREENLKVVKEATSDGTLSQLVSPDAEAQRAQLAETGEAPPTAKSSKATKLSTKKASTSNSKKKA